MPSAEFELLIQLTEYRWSAPVLRELLLAAGSKFVTLVRVLESNDGAIRRTLQRLIKSKWVKRNPGYGHPSRPEYILTSDGTAIARIAAGIVDHLRKSNTQDLLENRWGLPILLSLADGPLRHAELKRALGEVSPRALSLALEHMKTRRFVQRQVTEHRPPQVLYSLSKSGRALALAIKRQLGI